MANLTYRSVKGSPLTNAELDNNFSYFTGSHAVTGSLTVTGGITGSIASASYALTASYTLNGGNGGNIDTSSLATTGSNTFTDSQIIVGNVTFPSSSFISTTDNSGSLFLSALNNGTLLLNADGGEGDVQIGYNGWNNKLIVKNNVEITGSINFGDNSSIQSISASSGDGLGAATLELKPDASLISDQYIVLDPTSPNHIHIRAGGVIDESSAYLYLGGEKSNVVVRNLDNSFNEKHWVQITTTAANSSSFNWTFDNDGTLTAPGDILISGSIIPNTDGVSQTSSFSLGSPTNAWKDIYVSNGTINFLDGNGNVQGTLSSTANGIATNGDAYFNSVRIGQGPVFGLGNTVLGAGALIAATGSSSSNTAIGQQTLEYLTIGQNNTGVGAGSSQYTTAGAFNTSLGSAALSRNETGNFNLAVGASSLFNVRGGNNTALGTQAGFYSSGSSAGNVYVGYNAGPVSNTTENNKLYINNTTSATPLIGGDFSTGVVTINNLLQLQVRTTNPGSPVEGMIMASGSAGSSKLFYYNGTAWVDLTA